ncbi:MAG: cytochrome c oxidase subunit II [Chloroflexi bacterium]|nr:cytochrome c oxidase subunit II [Chloroflexota bacterium]
MIAAPKIPFSRILLAITSLSILVLAGCAGAPTMVAPASENAAMISDLFMILFVIAVIVFVIVEFLLFYSVIRFRRRANDGTPEQIHGNTKFEIAWTAAPAVVLAVIFVLTWQTLSALATTPADAIQIKVTGHQWWWDVEYTGLGIVTANEIHLPVGKAAAFTLEAKDVIHSFWVPELGGKTDLIPGHTNRMWIRPTQIGSYHGQCAEFCGTSHANMRFAVVVQSQADFDAWVAQQKQSSVVATTDLQKKGVETISTVGCQACHTINGVSAMVGKVGPNLTHVASRKQIASGILDFNAANLHTWLSDPPGVKPGALMPRLPLTSEQIDALVAYLTSLK